MTQVLGRFHIIEGTPPSLPGKCSVCGTTEGTFVDFGLDLDYYGVVYFCLDNCLVEMANAVDYHSPRQWKMLMNSYNEIRETYNNLVDENERLRNAVDSFNNLSLPDAPVSISNLVLSEKSDKESSEPDSSAEGDNTGSEEPEQGSAKQNDEPGLTDLQRDDSLDEFLDAI